MREIIFRGKAKAIKRGEWIEGSLVNTYDWYTREQHCFIVDDDYEDHDEWEVVPETVGQYAGLNDKNGKRIFEGDIIKIQAEDADQTIFTKVCFGEFIDENDSQFYLGFYLVGSGMTVSIFNGKDDGYDLMGMCEVVGSIHDNPELLVAE